MSLYNMLMGVNPFTPILKGILGFTRLEDDLYRFRDIYPNEDGDQVTVFTRIGGPNRKTHKEIIAYLRSHPWYEQDYDDEYDDTFASFVFVVPETSQEDIKEIAEVTDTAPPMERYRKLMTDLDEGVDNEATRQARAVLDKIGKELVRMVKEGSPTSEVTYEKWGVKLACLKPGQVKQLEEGRPLFEVMRDVEWGIGEEPAEAP